MRLARNILLAIALLPFPLACASDYDDPWDDHPQVIRARERQRNEENRSEYRRRD